MTELTTMVRGRALEEWYLAPDADEIPVRRHLCWQSPFAFGRGKGDAADRARRIAKAGDIWLRNYDLRFAGQLWISDHASGTTWAFRRCRTKGGQHLTVGPLPTIVVETGRGLFGYPIKFAESNDRDFDRMLMSLALP